MCGPVEGIVNSAQVTVMPRPGPEDHLTSRAHQVHQVFHVRLASWWLEFVEVQVGEMGPSRTPHFRVGVLMSPETSPPSFGLLLGDVPQLA